MTQIDTGTRDSTYDLVSVLYHSLQGAENCATYQQDADDDQQLSAFFKEAEEQQKELADRAKQLLTKQLA